MLRVPSVALLRVLALGVAAASAAGLLVTGPLGVPAVSADIVATDSAVSVKWQGGSSDLEKSQPARNPDSPHFGDFSNLSITVSQTASLTDQAIRVDFTGLAGTKTGTSSGNDVQNAQNFVQFMQCWGDPASANFRNTCEWGGYAVTPPSGLERSVPAESNLRGAKTPGDADVTFLSAQGNTYSGDQALNDKGQPYWPLGEMFDGSSSNEIVAARVGSSGVGTVNFETQSANRAPQLGCGSSTERLRCYLVAVPRGSHFGGDVGVGGCSQTASDANGPYTNGRPDSVQEGSPLNPACDYWDNRMVIPLDFTLLGNNCPTGSAERRTIGSQLVVGAMSSWQPAACQAANSVYNFSTNPDSIARSQLISGRAGLAFTSYAPEDDTLSAIDTASLAKTDITYAPVAISGVTMAFYVEDTTGRRSTLNLTPRLMAKLLTDSYLFQNPLTAVQDEVYSLPYLGDTATRYRFFSQDPEFWSINPDFTTVDESGTVVPKLVNPALVLPGPAGADAITQIWKWILADKAAAAWLTGVPDENGMRINPYYLPAGDPDARVPVVDEETGKPVLDEAGDLTYRAVGLSNVDGSPLKISQTVRDIFSKADQTEAPAQLSAGQKTRFGALQSAPYADTLLSTARAAFRADPASRTVWDPNKINAAGEMGDWVSSGAQLPGQKFVIAVTDTASAEKYGLSEASLCNSNASCTAATTDAASTFVAPTTETMSAAVSELAVTSNPQVNQVDPGAVSRGSYPLTTVTYAAVNLSLSDEPARAAYAALVAYAVTQGQVPGIAAGSLPLGYVPLTDALVQQSLVSVQTMLGYAPPVADSPSIGVSPVAASAPVALSPAPLQAAAAAAAVGAPQTSVTGIPTASATATASVETPWAYQGALGVSLIVGLAGAAFAPVLMRPRRQNG
jgi:hypothetical protein